MRQLLFIVGLVGCLVSVQAEDLCVVSYNIENLFHPKHDTVAGIEKEDMEWTAEGDGLLTEVFFRQILKLGEEYDRQKPDRPVCRQEDQMP